MRHWDQATAALPAPLLIVDLDAFEANHDDLVRRAGRLPVRVATKSVRVRGLLTAALERSATSFGRSTATPDGGATMPGFRGLMAYSLAEALWLAGSVDAGHGHTDIFVAYPSVDRAAIAELGRSAYVDQVTLAIDSREHAELIRQASGGAPLAVAIDVDASLRLGPAHLGVRRSPLRTPAQVREVVLAAQRSGLRVEGLMFYDAQIAGLPDSSPAVRLVKRRSHRELLDRRGAVVAAVRELTELRFVNGGGTGSLEVSGTDPALTELAAGSGLFGPTLFDGYRAFTPRPAAAFALPVVRKPAPDVATLFSGGYPASGPPGWNRVPRIVSPAGLRLIRTEGTGEVQTPVRGPGARALALGDRVWLRHAKAGEVCERFDRVHLIRGGELVDTLPTYRGEGRNFG